MTYYSQAWQDEFVINILNFKRDSFFVDVGAGDGMNQSNSYFLEKEMGWNGVCVERGIGYTEHYKNNRSCIFLNEDATKIDYKSLFEANNYPKRIDYLSMDIDENSMLGLGALPFDDYRFSVITAESDSYRLGDLLRSQERELLRHYGYTLLFEDVFVPIGCSSGAELPFEDWWVDSVVFDMEKLNKISAKRMYPDEIVAMMKKKQDIYVI